jgi:hypothetical protein
MKNGDRIVRTRKVFFIKVTFVIYHRTDKKHRSDICCCGIHTSDTRQGGLYSNLERVVFSTFSSIILSVRPGGEFTTNRSQTDPAAAQRML